MDIEFPSSLQWLAYLAGQAWPGPPASETKMWRIADQLSSAADGLEGLVPDLGRVRAETQDVLAGATAQAADEQFSKLFDGQYAVDKLVAALRALSGLAAELGTNIQYTKLNIVSTLGIAAGTISWALVHAEWTGGASLSEIPVAEETASSTIRELVSAVIARTEEALASTLTRTMVPRLLAEGGVATLMGAGQELAIEGVQVGGGHREGIDWGRVADSGLSMGVAGLTGAVVGPVMRALLGSAEGLGMGLVTGAVTGLSSGVAANVAATLVGGGHISADTFLGAGIGLVDGGVHGAGGDGAAGHGDTGAGGPDGPARSGPGGESDTPNEGGPQAHTASSTAPTEPGVVAGEHAPAGVSHCLCKGLGLNGGGRLAITGQENFVVAI